MKQLLTLIMLLIMLGVNGQDSNSIKAHQNHSQNSLHWALSHRMGNAFSEDGNNSLLNGIGISVLQNDFIYEVEFRKYLFSAQGCSSPDENRTFLGHSFGRFKDVNKMRYSLQVGIASLSGTQRTKQISRRDGFFCDHYTKYRTVDYHVVNYTVKLGAKYMPNTHFSIGIDLEANINSVANLIMPMLSIQFGNIRALLNKE